MISDGTNGDDACKSYEYYERDVQLLKNIGVSINVIVYFDVLMHT